MPGAEAQAPAPFVPVVASNEDKLILARGYRHRPPPLGRPHLLRRPEFDPKAHTAAKQGRQLGSDNAFSGSGWDGKAERAGRGPLLQ